MHAAVDVLDCLSNGSEIMDASMSEDTQTTKKLRIYQSIVDHYSSQNEPLWPECHGELHLELYSQLMQGRRYKKGRIA